VGELGLRRTFGDEGEFHVERRGGRSVLRDSQSDRSCTCHPFESFAVAATGVDNTIRADVEFSRYLDFLIFNIG
jgi:hypothetical protein